MKNFLIVSVLAMGFGANALAEVVPGLGITCDPASDRYPSLAKHLRRVAKEVDVAAVAWLAETEPTSPYLERLCKNSKDLAAFAKSYIEECRRECSDIVNEARAKAKGTMSEKELPVIQGLLCRQGCVAVSSAITDTESAYQTGLQAGQARGEAACGKVKAASGNFKKPAAASAPASADEPRKGAGGAGRGEGQYVPRGNQTTPP